MADSRKNIILDLDGTLIDAQYPLGAKSAFVLGCRAPVHICGKKLSYLHIYKRPGLDAFLTWCFENFQNVGLWTLSGPEWLEEILQHVLYEFPREKWSLLWSANRATRLSPQHKAKEDEDYVRMNGVGVVKDLNKVYRNKTLLKRGFNRHNTIIVEDNPSNCARNYGNAFYIQTFDILSCPNDKELPRLMRYCENTILPSSNVRGIEKRYWSEEIKQLEEEEKKRNRIVRSNTTTAFWMSDSWAQGIKAITAASIGFPN